MADTILTTKNIIDKLIKNIKFIIDKHDNESRIEYIYKSVKNIIYVINDISKRSDHYLKKKCCKIVLHINNKDLSSFHFGPILSLIKSLKDKYKINQKINICNGDIDLLSQSIEKLNIILNLLELYKLQSSKCEIHDPKIHNEEITENNVPTNMFVVKTQVNKSYYIDLDILAKSEQNIMVFSIKLIINNNNNIISVNDCNNFITSIPPNNSWKVTREIVDNDAYIQINGEDNKIIKWDGYLTSIMF